MAGSTVTFIVRLTQDKTGQITGIVQQVKTGRKERVEGLEAVGRTIAEMIARSSTDEAQDTGETGGPP